MHHDESLDRLNEIDEICDRFEQQCRAGASPRIEDVLAENAEVDRSRLLRELLLIELELLRDTGEAPTHADYAKRFPGDIAAVDEAVDTIRLRHSSAALDETVDVDGDPGEETYVPRDSSEEPTQVAAQQTVSTPKVGGRQFGDYELLHEIARGGMGVVYKALQTKLNRIVALKMIKAGELADDDAVRRFQAEAEAAAQLDHPNIVPIFEVGEWRAGGVSPPVHFFSMGFVDGAGLDARLKEGPLPPKDAAGLIKTIAEAVQYAHDKGIVHRDLKPANVLLAGDRVDTSLVDSQQTEPGRAASVQNIPPTTAVENPTHAARARTARLFVPKITDFGLAKNIAADSGMTATGQVLGTPSYMPPEQAAGKVDEVGPLADVYSLGAMLYATLTGRPPFQAANVMETLKQVVDREPVSPRTLNPAVDKDLETICLKCLEKEPSKRYASALDFARDLESCLAGRPIMARPVGPVARVWRWAGRNKALATAAGLMLVLAIAGPAVAVHLGQINQELDAALDGEKSARQTAETKEREATASAKAAREALAERDDALRETEMSYDDYVETVNNAELLKDRRFKPVLKALMKNSLQHYQRFVEKHRNEQDPETRARLANAMYKIGGINQRSGSIPQAIAAYRSGLATFQQLHEEFPDDVDYQHELATGFHDLSLLLDVKGDDRAAYETAVTGLKWSETVVGKSSDHIKELMLRAQVATAHGRVAITARQIGRWDEAMRHYRKMAGIRAKLADENPLVVKLQRDLAAANNNLANVLILRDKPKEAIVLLNKAAAIFERIVDDTGNPSEARAELAMAYKNLAKCHRLLGKTDDSVSCMERVLRIREQLVRDHPTVTDYEAELAASYQSIGMLLTRSNTMSKAMQHFEKAIAMYRKLHRENPAVDDYRYGLGYVLHQIGTLHFRKAEFNEALKLKQEAATILRGLAEKNKSNLTYLTRLATILRHIGDVYSVTKKFPEAVAAFEESIRVNQALIAKQPTLVEPKSLLASTYNSIGLHYSDFRMKQQALEAYRKTAAIFRPLAQKNPDVARFQTGLAGALVNIANQTRNSEPAAAFDQLSEAIRILTALMQSGRRSFSTQRFLRNAYAVRADLYERQMKYVESAADWQNAIKYDTGRDRMRYAIRLARTIVLSGNHTEARKMIPRLKAIAEKTLRGARLASAFYGFACVSSLAAGQLKDGDPEAAHQLWNRYFERLTNLARRKLGGLPKRDADEEDVAQSVFNSLCAGAAKGHFTELFDRNDLWPLLIRITHQKSVDRIRHANRQKRGGGKVRGDSAVDGRDADDAGGFDQFAGDAPTPAFLAEMTEEYRRLFESLRDETLKFTAWSRFEGHSNDEIAKLLGITTRSVERKLQLIRDTLTKQGAKPPE
eukprot:g22026.t1